MVTNIQNGAKGGIVEDVPRTAKEPDERVDKMTGIPYDEQVIPAITQSTPNFLERVSAPVQWESVMFPAAMITLFCITEVSAAF